MFQIKHLLKCTVCHLLCTMLTTSVLTGIFYVNLGWSDVSPLYSSASYTCTRPDALPTTKPTLNGSIIPDFQYMHVNISYMCQARCNVLQLSTSNGKIWYVNCIIMAALCSRCGHHILQLRFLSFFFVSSPILSSRRLDVTILRCDELTVWRADWFLGHPVITAHHS